MELFWRVYNGKLYIQLEVRELQLDRRWVLLVTIYRPIEHFKEAIVFSPLRYWVKYVDNTMVIKRDVIW